VDNQSVNEKDVLAAEEKLITKIEKINGRGQKRGRRKKI
jgi:hypothetical protein